MKVLHCLPLWISAGKFLEELSDLTFMPYMIESSLSLSESFLWLISWLYVSYRNKSNQILKYYIEFSNRMGRVWNLLFSSFSYWITMSRFSRGWISSSTLSLFLCLIILIFYSNSYFSRSMALSCMNFILSL